MSHILEFLDLVDVPDTYAGSGGYRLRVDSTPDAVEFIADTFTNLSDTPADYSGFPNYYVKVNSGATALEFQSAANLETALGGPFLPLTAGSGEELSGDLYLDTASGAKVTAYYDGGTTASMTMNSSNLKIETSAGVGGSGALQIHPATGLTYTDNTTTDYTVWTEKDFDYTDYLLLTGGNLTGNLYIDTATAPALQLRPAATAADRLVLSKDASGTASLLNYAETGQALTRIDAIPSDTTSSALYQFFRTTSTSGSRWLSVYQGDGTATVAWYVNAGSGAVFHKTGDLYLDKASDPTIYLREGASATDYSSISNTQSNLLSIKHTLNSGASYIRLDPLPSDGTSAAFVQLFRETNSTSSHSFILYRGDDTATIDHRVDTGTSGDAAFCINGGSLSEGGNDVLTEGAAEFSAITEKTTPVSADLILIEDSAASNAKKKVQISNLPGGGSDLDLDTYQIVMTVYNGSGGTMSAGDLAVITDDQSSTPLAVLADADSTTTATGKLVCINETINTANSGEAVVKGYVSGFSGLTDGAPQYISTTAGDFTETAPSGDGDIVRIAGYAMSATEILFDPSNSWLEIGGGIGSYLSLTDIHLDSFTVGTAATDIEFDKERQTHDDFTHSMVTNPEEVTCNFDGKVEITVTGSIFENATNSCLFYLQKDTGGGYATITDSQAYADTIATSKTYDSFAIHLVESVGDGDKIKLVGDAVSASVELDYCRMSLKKLEHGVAPPTPNTGVPAHRSVVYADSSIYAAASTYATVFDITNSNDGGMLYYLYNDYTSDVAAQRYYFQVTVDGSYTITSNTYLRGGTTYSSGIGPTAITQCITPIYFSSSCKLEIGNYVTAGIKYYRYAYYLYDIV